MLTAPGLGIREEPETPLGMSHLIGTLGRLARLTTALDAALVVDVHPVGSARWWLAVHTLGQRAEGSYRFLAGRTAEPSQGGQRSLRPD